MTNKREFEDYIKDKRVSMKELAEAVKMDYSTFYRKMRRPVGSFTVEEAGILAERLGMTAYEATRIFFNRELA